MLLLPSELELDLKQRERAREGGCSKTDRPAPPLRRVRGSGQPRRHAMVILDADLSRRPHAPWRASASKSRRWDAEMPLLCFSEAAAAVFGVVKDR